MSKELTREDVVDILREMNNDDPGADEWLDATVATINKWLDRGDGVAVYINQDMDSISLGHRQIASFGSKVAQLEMETAPKQLPDIGGHINWRYQLEGTYRGERLSVEVSR